MIYLSSIFKLTYGLNVEFEGIALHCWTYVCFHLGKKRYEMCL